MKNKTKPREMKHKIHGKERIERLGLSAKVAILIIIIFVSGLIINSLLNQPTANQTVDFTSTPKAAIVDHLSLIHPNQAFIQTTTNTLNQAGYTVDYYPSEKVTVEFYRNLPTCDYGLIILRAHSGFIKGGGTSIFFFSSEPYSSQKYVYEQLTDQIALTRLEEGGPTYFGINENFVKSSMKGTFNNAIVIAMGCNGLRYTTMAKAFRERGARFYMGYNEPVMASYTDQEITHLLQYFLLRKHPLKQALQETLKEVGADSTYNSLLLYYPLEAGNCTIQNVVGDFATSNMKIQHEVHFENKEICNY